MGMGDDGNATWGSIRASQARDWHTEGASFVISQKTRALISVQATGLVKQFFLCKQKYNLAVSEKSIPNGLKHQEMQKQSKSEKIVKKKAWPTKNFFPKK